MLRSIANLFMPSVEKRLKREIHTEEHATLDALRNLEYAQAQLQLCQVRLTRARAMLSNIEKEKNPP